MGKKLLVADDSVTIQKVIRLALSNEGYEIQAVSDGNDAIQQIAVFRPNIVLIDVSLPSKTAFEVKRAINAHRDLKEVRFVLMSSAFEKVDEVQAEEVHFHARLTKPFDPAHLREILTQVLIAPSSSLSAQEESEEESELISESVTLERQESPAPTQLPPIPPSTSESNNPVASPFDDFSMEALTPASSAMPAADDDIRQLTESTIRIAGIPNTAHAGDSPSMETSLEKSEPQPSISTPQDDLGWSVQEPVLKPTPSFLEQSEEAETTFPLMDSLQAGANAYHAAPDEPIFSEFLKSALGKATATQAATAPPPPPPRSLPVAPPPPPLPEGNPFFQSQELISKLAPKTEAPAISEKEMEKLVATKVQEAIQKMVQTNLPDIIEKVVKEEIHRLLSEQP